MTTPKLSSLSPSDKIRLAAELDGVEYEIDENCDIWMEGEYRDYSTSYDAIIPLIQKQDEETRIAMFHDAPDWTAATAIMRTPSQLLDALLIATGKAEL